MNHWHRNGGNLRGKDPQNGKTQAASFRLQATGKKPAGYFNTRRNLWRTPETEHRTPREAGSVLITTIIMLTFLTILGLSLLSFLFCRLNYSQVQLDRFKALYLAEAGIAKSFYELKLGIDTDDNGIGNIVPTELGAGAYKVEHNFQTSTITAIGETNGIKRTIQIKYSAL